MSQPVVNYAKCGKPKAPPVTTQQSAREAWPTGVEDTLHVIRQFLDAYKGDSVTVNGRRMGVPPIPSLIPSTENPATSATNEPVTVNERRVGVPDLPPLVLPKEAA